MGARGPIRNPFSIRGEKSTGGPKPRPMAPKCPRYLSKVARREWRRIVPELDRLGILSSVDGGALEAYCNTYANMVEAQQVLNESGFTFTTEKGFVAKRPEVAVVEKSMQLLRTFAAELGLSPAARMRMSVSEGEDVEDPMDALLRGDPIRRSDL